MDKEQDLLKLARLRQSKVYDGYKSIGDYANGAYECDYVSPYSKSAHHVDTDIFIILQDWSSDENMQGNVCEETNKYGYTPNVGTNKNLIKLLKEHLKLELKDTYATNLFPYIKHGGMSAHIPPKVMQKSAAEFTLPMIKIIKPKIVIALGMKTFNALRQSIKLRKVYNMKKAAKNTFDYDGIKIFFQAHPSQQSQNRRGKNQVKEDWLKMKEFL